MKTTLFDNLHVDYVPAQPEDWTGRASNPDMENQSFPFPVLTKRKKALVKKCQQLKISTFDLKNTTWRSMNGSLRQSMRIQSLLDRRHMTYDRTNPDCIDP